MSAEIVDLSEVRDRRNERRDIAGRAQKNARRALELLNQGAPADVIRPVLQRCVAQLDLMGLNL